MNRISRSFGLLLSTGILVSVAIANPPAAAVPAYWVTVGKSLIIDSDADLVRVAVGSATVADAVAISSREVLVNGILPGETSLVIWEVGGARLVYDLCVLSSAAGLEAVRRQIAVIGASDVTVDFENGTAFLHGTVKDTVTAERVAVIAGTLGKVANLLYVAVPPVESQILLKVRFANVDRAASSQLGVNLISTGHLSTPGGTSTGQFTLGDALNLLLFRKDFNLSATLTALHNDNLLEILAEPNLLVIDGKSASFVAGGEFPYPTVQGGAAAGAVTIAFREFGVRLNFLPNVTPRGTIRLHVTPEVSSLDFANGLVFQGFHIPAFATRKVDTEVELESGQSFVIAGLLDKRVTEILSKVPGIGDIPILGRLFQNRSHTTSDSELLIIITPELVRPIPAGVAIPDLNRPREFMQSQQETPRTPGLGITGPVPVSSPIKTIPLEQLLKNREEQRSGNPAQPQVPALTPAKQDGAAK